MGCFRWPRGISVRVHDHTTSSRVPAKVISSLPDAANVMGVLGVTESPNGSILLLSHDTDRSSIASIDNNFTMCV